jgi:hypothetical protein
MRNLAVLTVVPGVLLHVSSLFCDAPNTIDLLLDIHYSEKDTGSEATFVKHIALSITISDLF